MLACTRIAISSVAFAGSLAASAAGQTPWNLPAAELLQRFHLGDDAALYQVFEKCPTASARSDSILIGIMQTAMNRERTMNAVAALAGGNRLCGDPRVNIWIREKLSSSAWPPPHRAHLASMLLAVDAPGAADMVEEWVFSDGAEIADRYDVLSSLAVVLPYQRRLALFLRAYRNTDLPQTYLTNELSYFRRIDFEGSRREMLAAILARPDAKSTARLIEALSHEAAHFSPSPAWSSEVKAAIEQVLTRNGQLTPDVRSAARNALERLDSRVIK